MLIYDLSKRGKTPIYIYLYLCIRQDIIDGKLAEGTRLPSKRTLAKHLNVGVITVANAYEELVAEGFVVPKEKRGYFVNDLSYYQQPKTEFPDIPEISEYDEAQDYDFFADFKANRSGLQFFPKKTWNQCMRNAISSNDESLFQTIPYNGLLILRQAIADHLKQIRGMVVSPLQIIIGAGTEYLYGRLMQMFGSASTFAIEDPGYKKFGAISASYGVPWKYVPIDEDGLIIEELENSGADVVHISPSNHFPTGIVMPISRRIALFEWANRAKKRYIIEDDYDSEFRYNGRLISPLYVQSTEDKVIYINTFSKSLVPSLRISYMVLPLPLLKRYTETMSFYSCTVSSFEQYALAKFISGGHLERHINRLRNYYRIQRQLILNAIKRSSLSRIARVEERHAGTHFLLYVKTTLSEDQVRQKGLEYKIHLSFLSEYYSTPPRDENQICLVINYAAVSRDNIDEVIRRIASIFPECAEQAGPYDLPEAAAL